ncbi:MAG: Rpn family recombination-promoting nuclease/putative transposase [Candidatus Omnitrophota bacterium]
MKPRRQIHIIFDWALKKMLKRKANFGILEGFLSELIKEDIKILAILHNEGNDENVGDQLNRIDILAKDANNQLIRVELQNIREYDYFYKILYNKSQTITEYLQKDELYQTVKKIIIVNIVYFNLGKGQDYVYYGDTYFKGIHKNDMLELSEAEKKMFKRKTVSSIEPKYYIIKVKDFNDIVEDTLDEWIYYFKNIEIKNEFKAKGLAEARQKLKEIYLQDQSIGIGAYRHYLDGLREEASIAETIRFESEFNERKATEKGMEKGILKTAAAMKNHGIDIAVIMDCTGLSKEVIDNL